MTEQVEVLIVGSGPAGATYARTIADAVPSARILMVEVGPDIPGLRGEHTHNMSPDARVTAQLLTQGPDSGVMRRRALSGITRGGDPSLEFRNRILPGLFSLGRRPVADGEVGLPAASMTSAVGGMGIHWGASTPRPQQSERIPFIASSELDEALNHAESLLRVAKWQVPGAGPAEALRREMATEFDGPDYTPVGFMPVAVRFDRGEAHLSGTGVILGDLESVAPEFELRSETLAKRVIVNDRLAVGAVLEDRTDGDIYEVRANHVVICADGLRTAQLLFASHVRPPALGHFLNEHFQVGAFGQLSEPFDHSTDLADEANLGYVIVPFCDARPMQGGAVLFANSPFSGLLEDDEQDLRAVAVGWYGVKDIQYGDRVEFSETATDFYGMPEMTIRYSHTARDRATIAEMKRNAQRSADRIGMRGARIELGAGGASLHYQGTVRMGASDDGVSVCGEKLRVWGFDNLYVGGNGVIPTATATNPTLTTVALAWRAARTIAEEMRGTSGDGETSCLTLRPTRVRRAERTHHQADRV